LIFEGPNLFFSVVIVPFPFFSMSKKRTMSTMCRTRREHGVQLRMIHWISEEKLLKLKRIIEKKNKTRR